MAGFWGIVRSTLATVARGFLLGLGFSLALGGSYVLIWQPLIADANRQITIAMARGANSDKELMKGLVFSNLAEIKHDGVTAIVGSVRNSGKEPVFGVTLQANLFRDGKFVDKYSTSLSESLAPGDSQYFKISCSCDGAPPAEHDSFKVVAVSSYH